MSTSAIMSQFTELMAGIGKIPSHVEAGRILYVDSMDERAALDPLIDTNSTAISKSQTTARLVRMASTYSKDDGRERSFETLKSESSFFSEVDRFDKLLDAPWESPLGKAEAISLSKSLALPVRDTLIIYEYYDDFTLSNMTALYEKASMFESFVNHISAKRKRAIYGKSVSEAALEDRAARDDMAKAHLLSGVLFSALGDFEDSSDLADRNFFRASMQFSRPFDRAIAAEAAILMNATIKFRYENAAACWLRVAKDLPFVDPLGVKIALFRGLHIAAVVPHNTFYGNFLKISIALNGAQMAFADMAEDHMRLAHWRLYSEGVDEEKNRKHQATLFIPFEVRLEKALDDIEKAAQAWHAAGYTAKSELAHKLASDSQAWIKEQGS